MALIKCPECGKEISDKASACIYCGFPLGRNIKKASSDNICVINGTPFDLSEILQDVNNFFINNPNATLIEESDLCLSLNRKIRRMVNINDFASAALASKIIEERAIPNSFTSSKFSDPTSFNQNVVRCPRCGSTSISTGARGVNHFWGFIGASKTVNRCAKCGHMWEPKG